MQYYFFTVNFRQVGLGLVRLILQVFAGKARKKICTDFFSHLATYNTVIQKHVE